MDTQLPWNIFTLLLKIHATHYNYYIVDPAPNIALFVYQQANVYTETNTGHLRVCILRQMVELENHCIWELIHVIKIFEQKFL